VVAGVLLEGVGDWQVNWELVQALLDMALEVCVCVC
jgi:hypothetical protein